MTDRRLQDLSAPGQRARLLERLQSGPIDTMTARLELNVLHPAARIQELRERGHRINTHRRTIEGSHGAKHPRVAVYYLSTSQTEERPTP